MYQVTAPTSTRTPFGRQLPPDHGMVQVAKLTSGQEPEVLAFLGRRPIHTVALVGFIRDNGLVSPLNRGTFYVCRDPRGHIEGIALIGHATLMETTSDRALEAFAEIAQKCTTAHLIMGEQERVRDFWNHYAEEGQDMRFACRELLFELRWPVKGRGEIPGLRLATEADLELIIPVQAQMAFDESGVNPLEYDAAGFRNRCARRIKQGRTWVWIEGGQLMFKAEVVADTASVIYLEGIWTNEEQRAKGYGLRCMSQLANQLLTRTKSITVLVNEANTNAHKFYQKAGYELRGIYDTIFLS